MTRMKNTVTTIQKQKETGDKITMLTCYDYTMAKLIEKANINTVLVGDSLGQVVLGYSDTLSVTMEDMIHHCAAVSRGLKDTFLIVDMPFMSYQTSEYDALVNAGRLMKEGHANAVKLEGGRNMCSTIRRIVDAGIPVCAHLGLTPQSINALGGFKVSGKTREDAANLIEDAKAVQEAGAFLLVLECVPDKLARHISEILTIPTIGIGSGNGCDGQVLVYQDMLGMFDDFVPKFVKHYAHVGETMVDAFSNYAKEVKNMEFPGPEHVYRINDDVIDKLY